MNYGYIRVSTDKQTVENQRFEILQFCQHEGIKIDGWIEETVSGGKAPDKRKLGLLLKEVKEGDWIICSELSRLGRSLFMIMNILSLCMEKGLQYVQLKITSLQETICNPKSSLLLLVSPQKLKSLLYQPEQKQLSKKEKLKVQSLEDPKVVKIVTTNSFRTKMLSRLLLSKIILMLKQLVCFMLIAQP